MRWVVNASSADCTISVGSNKPSPVTSTTCSATRPSVTCGLVVTLLRLPCSLMVPFVRVGLDPGDQATQRRDRVLVVCPPNNW